MQLAGTHRYDIDLAHRVTSRQAAEGRPKPIVPLDLIFFFLGVCLVILSQALKTSR